MICIETCIYEMKTLTVHEKSFLTNSWITGNVFYFNAFLLAVKKGLPSEFGPNHSLENLKNVKHTFSSNCALTRFLWGSIISIQVSRSL